jgi:hypothetical protein
MEKRITYMQTTHMHPKLKKPKKNLPFLPNMEEIQLLLIQSNSTPRPSMHRKDQGENPAPIYPQNNAKSLYLEMQYPCNVTKQMEKISKAGKV